MYTENPITLVMADDHELTVDGFCSMARKMPGIQLLATAPDGVQLLEKVRIHQPQVVVTDIKMPLMDGVAATIAIKKEYPSTRVLALSCFDEVNLVKEMMDAGADGYALKEIRKEELINAIKIVISGAKFYCSHTVKNLLDFQTMPQPEGVRFTTRELEVLRLICSGYTNKMISTALGMGLRTVEAHRAKIYQKAGVFTSVSLALFAKKHGYLQG